MFNIVHTIGEVLDMLFSDKNAAFGQVKVEMKFHYS